MFGCNQNQYVKSIDNMPTYERRSGLWVRGAIAGVAAQAGGLVCLLAEIRLDASIEAQRITGEVNLGLFGVASIACIAAGYNNFREARANKTIWQFENDTIEDMAASRHNQDLVWIADLIDPPTED